MKRIIVKFANGVLDYTEFVPLGWVMTCYELGIDWISKNITEGIMTPIASTFIVSILWVFGYSIAHGGSEGLKEEKHDGVSLWVRVKRLLIILAVLFWVTIMLLYASPPGDVV